MNLILLVGPPGSGKTTFANSLKSYNWINQDAQGKFNHFELFTQLVALGRPIVVDRMNFSVTQRARYIDLAKAAGYQVKIYVLNTPKALCLKRCYERIDHPTIKDLDTADKVIDFFYKNYEAPTDAEGIVIDWKYFENVDLGMSNAP